MAHASRALLALGLLASCGRAPGPPAAGPPAAPERLTTSPSADAAPPARAPSVATDSHASERALMVARQIVARGVRDERVLEAMRKVPRHLFVPAGMRASAYADHPLPIGHEQTISQPYIVAAMSELAAVTSTSRVLEIGTGSGYQAAVLCELAAEVYTIEIVEPLARSAETTLRELGYRNVTVRAGDGYQGWREAAPFDAIVVTAAPPRIPKPLEEQLAPGGRLVIPVGEDYQELRLVTRGPDGLSSRSIFPVRFVPMTGEAQRR